MIDTSPKLTELLDRLAHASWIALDTEADSLHAYPEKLCLVQLSFPGADLLADPLAGVDFAPLWKSLASHNLILHGADYDLRLINRIDSFEPASLFDTMEAARLAGCREFGLTQLVTRYLGVPLEKGPQKANWARRPLTDRMAAYAQNDTRYLKPLADHLKIELQEKGRLSWHQETCARLVAECAKPREADSDLVWRIKGCHRLDRRGLAVLRALWHWREAEAVQANRPVFFVLPHESMVALAAAAASARPLVSLIPPRFSSRRCQDLEAAIARGLSVSAADLPRFLRPTIRHPSEAEKRRYEALKKKRDHLAAQLQIDPTLIASRATLEDLARDGELQSGKLMTWQRALME